ncbi:MAG: sigma-70 family RNA polymerase sigma factor [Saprospiraceae bacterium]
MNDPDFAVFLNGDPLALKKLMDRLFPLILKLVQSNSGTHEDAQDVFMYGITELFVKAQQGTLRQEAQLSTILYAICRNHWLKTLRKNNPNAELTNDLENVLINIDPEDEEDWERIQVIRQQMEHLSKTCRRLIELVFHTDLDMQQIADELGLTYGSARVRKTECLAKLRELVKKALPKD